MYINPTLVLLLALIFVFSPSLQEWVLSGDTAWYRPWLVWIGLLLVVYFGQRSKSDYEL